MPLLNIKMVIGFVFIALTSVGQNNTKTDLQEENIVYYGDGAQMIGFIVFDKDNHSKQPAVLVIPEWWGFTEYTKRRARQLASLGYVAMVVDIYGAGKQLDNPDSAGKYAMIYYLDPLKAKRRLDAAIIQLKKYSQVDSFCIAAIGYCFGGSLLLNAARLGENIKGVVSFHGSPIGSFHGNIAAGTPLRKELLRAKILVCHGSSDQYVPQKDVELFKRQMDSAGIPYTLKIYDSAAHAFTNPASTELGIRFNMPIAYNQKADTDSWNDMQLFLREVFNN